jgi:hypothetical protein
MNVDDNSVVCRFRVSQLTPTQRSVSVRAAGLVVRELTARSLSWVRASLPQRHVEQEKGEPVNEQKKGRRKEGPIFGYAGRRSGGARSLGRVIEGSADWTIHAD